MGYILLEGGAEFGGDMEAADRRALELAGGLHAPISIIPAAAAPAKDHQNAGNNGVQWFRSLGATNVTALPLIDRESAEDRGLAEILRKSGIIYMLGGSPRYLEQCLRASAAWQAILTAYEMGAVVGGSSAGAMVLCEHYYDPFSLIPHYDTFGYGWLDLLLQLLPDSIFIGIDEQTGMVNGGLKSRWQVYGKGTVRLFRSNEKSTFGPGQVFELLI
ncbi:MAG: Type 1 glutamine amidotransferase-like domain-containing protein [Deltaproteobacteria bacterium]